VAGDETEILQDMRKENIQSAGETAKTEKILLPGMRTYRQSQNAEKSQESQNSNA